MNSPVSCPGCGAPHEPSCRYCGRRSAAPLAQVPYYLFADIRPYGLTTMSNGLPYIPPGRKPEQSLGFWRSMLGVAGGLLP